MHPSDMKVDSDSVPYRAYSCRDHVQQYELQIRKVVGASAQSRRRSDGRIR